jgi:hypothetical protein
VKRNSGVLHLVSAIAGAMVSFCLVATAIYYRMADVRVNGFFHGGPASLAAAMAGLFGGGIVAVVVLVSLLRWGNSRS